MARSTQKSHRIIVRDEEYRWRAGGNDGYIPVTIGPTSNIGSSIHCSFGYHETTVSDGDGLSP
jgi:hypothetical protein